MAARKFMICEINYFKHDRKDTRVQITRIAPYDETEYHWALSTSSSCTKWQIIYGNKVVTSLVGADDNTIADTCRRLDEEMGLHRTGGIN